MKPFALLLCACAARRRGARRRAARSPSTPSRRRDAPDLTSVRAKIKAKDFKGAIAELTPMLETHQHADVYNLMGFSLRKTGDYKQAYTFYRKALDFDPEHKGALEYLGELYVETGQIDKAKENVALLEEALPERLRGARRSRGGDRRRGAEGELRRADAVSHTWRRPARWLGRLLLAAIFLHEAWAKLTGYAGGGRLHAGLRRARASCCRSRSRSSSAAGF